jgi:hypothetical protein
MTLKSSWTNTLLFPSSHHALNENVGVGFLFNPPEQHPGKDKEEEGGGRGALVRQSPSFLPSNNSSLPFIQIQIDSPSPVPTLHPKALLLLLLPLSVYLDPKFHNFGLRSPGMRLGMVRIDQMDAAENGWTGSGRNRRKSNGEERGKLLNGSAEAKHRKQKGMALWKVGIGLMFMLLIVLALFVMMVGMDNAIQTGTTMLKKVAQKGEQMNSNKQEKYCIN